jgi:hypothetical protein
MVGILSFLVILLVSVLITKVATIALAHTGLSHESARFQARSAFTGVGFTTNEAERVVTHPVRRRSLGKAAATCRALLRRQKPVKRDSAARQTWPTESG